MFSLISSLCSRSLTGNLSLDLSLLSVKLSDVVLELSLIKLKCLLFHSDTVDLVLSLAHLIVKTCHLGVLFFLTLFLLLKSHFESELFCFEILLGLLHIVDLCEDVIDELLIVGSYTVYHLNS